MMKAIRDLAIAATSVLCAIAAGPAAGQDPISGLIARNPGGLQQVLVTPMEPGDPVGTAGWRMTGLEVREAAGVAPRVGRGALTFAGMAEIPGAKGDFRVHGSLPGRTEMLGLWVHLRDDANIAQLGIQVTDAEDEVLTMLVPAEGPGWRWIEFALSGDHVKQAYPQPGKNATADAPLKSLHVVWFAADRGATSLTVDGLAALVDRPIPAGPPVPEVSLLGPALSHPGETPAFSVLVQNPASTPVELDVAYSLQRDPALYSVPVPDPVYGTNHAPAGRSRTVADGETIEEGSLTDGKHWTDAGTAYKADHFTEAFQYVELDRPRTITKMTWLSGDANHTWLVDVAASQDGETFSPVPGLLNVDQHKKWGWQTFPRTEPFLAGSLRFRYHTASPDTKVPAIRFPSELAIYDGTADETLELPSVGELLAESSLQVSVPARSFRLEALPVRTALDTGAYLLAVKTTQGEHVNMVYRHVHTAPETDDALVTAGSRFGLNAAHGPLAPKLRELGIGWVRFENMKWPFVSPEPHVYGFTGTVPPWQLNIDEIFAGYKRNGLNVLSYMFLTPEWASTAPEGTKQDRAITFPPKDPALFGEFCFQVVARYGTRKHPADVLLSDDKASGLDLVHCYEMWNEPDLNPRPDATWGGWSAPVDEYYRMMRHGAEAVKRADPTAIVTSAGYANMRPEVIDRLRTYEYEDGKRPLDFIEVLNVHYYSGRNPPETAMEDGNAGVVGNTTFVQDLEELTAWRDRHAPGMPIWMTETGYDSAGPFGTTETIQAARLPRVVMLCLAHGVDKVFVYRESGSTPSMHACSGLLRDDFSEKPSWFTFGTLVRQFRDVKAGAQRMPHADGNVWLLKWDAGGQPLLTAWTVEGTARLGLDFGACTVTDAFGAEVRTQGTADLELTQFPVYIRGLEDSPAWRGLLEAYAEQQRELQRRRERAIARRKHLYDFGGWGRVGYHLLEGIKFPYAPVNAKDTWDETRGYGFRDAAYSDEDHSWVRSKLAGDGCRVGPGMPFRVRVPAGTYDLSVGFGAGGEAPTVRVEGLPEPLELPLDRKTESAEAQLSLTSPAVLSFSHDGYGEFRWISLVETE